MDSVKRVLFAFREQIALQMEAIPDTPNSAKDKSYLKAQCWLAGGLSVEEFKKFSFSKEFPKFYVQPAEPLYNEWRNLERDVIFRGTNIPQPNKMQLNQYLEYLFIEILQNKESRAVWLKSLRSFINFIRKKLPFEMRWSLDLLFPQKMEIRKITGTVPTPYGNRTFNRNVLITNTAPSAYPIDYAAQSQIMENLALLATEGRPNIQQSAAEALGLSWCCTIAALARLRTQEQLIYQLPLINLQRFDKSETQPEFSLKIPSLRGVLEVPISSGHYALLAALPRPQKLKTLNLFTKPLPSLLRTLYKAVEMSEKATGLGEITFLTFMTRSHHEIGQRFSGF